MNVMSRPRRARWARIGLWLMTLSSAFVVLSTTPGQAAEMPANASAKSYGGGWACDAGFRRDGARCVKIDVPANAYLADIGFGKGWSCHRGYREVAGRCEAVRVPANGFLNSSGSDWYCGRGFKKTGEECRAVPVPANGYLTDSGDGWECARGFRAEGADSRDPTGRAIQLLALSLAPEGFGKPTVQPEDEPGVFSAHFPPASEGAGLKVAAQDLTLSGEERLAHQGAIELLEGMVRQEWLELESPNAISKLAPGFADVLDRGGSGPERAGKVVDWLIEQPGVEDVHCMDDELAPVLDKFWG